MDERDKRVTYFINGATVDDVVYWLKDQTIELSGFNHRREFQVEGGYWRLLPAARVLAEEDRLLPSCTEVAIEAHLVSDDPDGWGVGSGWQSLGRCMSFCIYPETGEETTRVWVLVIAPNWQGMPPTVQTYLDRLLARFVRTMDAFEGVPPLMS